MKKLLLTILIFLLCFSALAQEPNAKIITELGIVYVGMPKEYLAEAGYTDLLQKGYRREGNEEWITFLNWTTEEPDDLVTFYIVDGKVKGWKEK